jgi:coenzyme PQQ synthesis protein D (PqqD)
MSTRQESRGGSALLDAQVKIPEHVVHREFAQETVVLNLETGRYHGLNPVAGRMLVTLQAAPSVREAAAALATEYAHPVAEVERDICAFCDDLAARGLIELEFGATG